MNSKLRYFLVSLKKQVFHEGFNCPSCHSSKNDLIDRKYFVTSLRRCKQCKLFFRTPTTTEKESSMYYQEEYQEGFTTELPTREILNTYIKTSFQDSDKDYTDQISVLETAGITPGMKLLDFGCSWGYGSWQLSQFGLDVKAYELSSQRSKYAHQELGVEIIGDPYIFRDYFDVFFTAHVLEHVPSIMKIIDLAFLVTKPGGLIVSFTPNGSLSFREIKPKNWHQIWGLKHPNLLDDVYYQEVFQQNSYYLASSPYNKESISAWARNAGQYIGDMHGDELLMIARK
jgi:2-polyprenyl-3-methyl-5-hydroxy-6-metoxy-1,4-benzoquinol methylase